MALVPKGAELLGYIARQFVGRTLVNGFNDVAVAGTQEHLTAASAPCLGVIVQAKRANTGNIYVGGSDIDSTMGLSLAAGESVFIAIDDAYNVWLDADTGTEGVTYLYIVKVG